MSNDRLWGLSLIIVAACNLTLMGTSAAGVQLPEPIVRVLGILQLAFLPVLVYATIRKFRKK